MMNHSSVKILSGDLCRPTRACANSNLQYINFASTRASERVVKRDDVLVFVCWTAWRIDQPANYAQFITPDGEILSLRAGEFEVI
jgi:hypothetical protein